MPAVGIATGGAGKEYPGKLTSYVLIICIIAAMGGLIFGYDIGISGNYFLNHTLVITYSFWLSDLES